jgi:sensor domain DACNV-containing protein
MTSPGYVPKEPPSLPSVTYTWSDLATAVESELVRRSLPNPGQAILIELFEAMFFTSLKTEESEPVLFHIVYLDPEKPDPNPPERLVHDRWSCVRLEPPVALNGSNFVKIAAASDPRTSSFAVYHDDQQRLTVWGLVDQGNTYHDYVNFDSDSGPERPGLFQASIVGIGHVVAYIGYEKVAELKLNAIIRSAVDVLQIGKVRDVLDAGIQAYLRSLTTAWPDEFPDDHDYWQSRATVTWLSSIRRLVLRAQGIRHGGAFLITPDKTYTGLSIKHKVQYVRLRSALQRHALAAEQQVTANGIIFDDYLEKDVDDMPIWLHLDDVVSRDDLDEIRNELHGAIWFVSLLTRVDGLVLLNPELEVQGFGVEITTPEEPSELFVASDAWATESSLRRVDYLLYGTRHRSMMRYCAKVPGSLGLVISQDGDVRVMTNVEGRLILWENIRLQLPTFVRTRRRLRRRRIRRRRAVRARSAPAAGSDTPEDR